MLNKCYSLLYIEPAAMFSKIQNTSFYKLCANTILNKRETLWQHIWHWFQFGVCVTINTSDWPAFLFFFLFFYIIYIFYIIIYIIYSFLLCSFLCQCWRNYISSYIDTWTQTNALKTCNINMQYKTDKFAGKKSYRSTFVCVHVRIFASSSVWYTKYIKELRIWNEHY